MSEWLRSMLIIFEMWDDGSIRNLSAGLGPGLLCVSSLDPQSFCDIPLVPMFLSAYHLITVPIIMVLSVFLHGLQCRYLVVLVVPFWRPSCVPWGMFEVFCLFPWCRYYYTNNLHSPLGDCLVLYLHQYAFKGSLWLKSYLKIEVSGWSFNFFTYAFDIW